MRKRQEHPWRYYGGRGERSPQLCTEVSG
jgi:hypothetical protein